MGKIHGISIRRKRKHGLLPELIHIMLGLLETNEC